MKSSQKSLDLEFSDFNLLINQLDIKIFYTDY
jgi:hypothetical protein